MSNEIVTLKEHLDALTTQRDKYELLLRAADLKAVDQAAEWTKERLQSHNDLLNKWRDATEKDRGNFVTMAAFDALKDAFGVYKEATLSALKIAEGKSRGFDAVRTGISFVLGVVVSGVGLWIALHTQGVSP